MIGSAKRKFNLEGWPKLARLIGAVGLVGLLAATTSACSSTGSEEGEEEVVDEEGGNEAAAVAKEDSVPKENAVATDAGAEAGNATTDAGAPPENISTGVDQVSNVPPTDSAAAGNAADAVPADAAVADAPEAALADAAAPAADAKAPASAAAPSAASAGPGLPAGTNAVVYVGGERAAIYDAPNGREVGRLAHGDFVLASAEGEWAKTSDGRFIKSAELQVKPVGRKIVQSRWRSPRSGH